MWVGVLRVVECQIESPLKVYVLLAVLWNVFVLFAHRLRTSAGVL